MRMSMLARFVACLGRSTSDDHAAARGAVYLACGYTDMRKGMSTLAMLVQQTLETVHFLGRFTCSAAAAVDRSKCCGTMALGCVCSSNAWNAGNSSGRCHLPGLYRSHRVSFPRCSKDASGELVGPRRYGGIRAAITRDGGGTSGGHLPDRPVRPGAADRLGGVFLALYPDSAGSRTNRLPNRLSGILLTE